MTPAPAYKVSIDIYQYIRMSYLMAGENQCIGDNYVLSATCSENDNLGDVLGRQWLAAAIHYQTLAFPYVEADLRVNSIRLRFIAVEPDNRELL